MVSVQATLPGPTFGQSYTAVCTWIARTVPSKSLQFKKQLGTLFPLLCLAEVQRN